VQGEEVAHVRQPPPVSRAPYEHTTAKYPLSVDPIPAWPSLANSLWSPWDMERARVAPVSTALQPDPSIPVRIQDSVARGLAGALWGDPRARPRWSRCTRRSGIAAQPPVEEVFSAVGGAVFRGITTCHRKPACQHVLVTSLRSQVDRVGA
jgi:hypothetical protein